MMSPRLRKPSKRDQAPVEKCLADQTIAVDADLILRQFSRMREGLYDGLKVWNDPSHDVVLVGVVVDPEIDGRVGWLPDHSRSVVASVGAVQEPGLPRKVIGVVAGSLMNDTDPETGADNGLCFTTGQSFLWLSRE